MAKQDIKIYKVKSKEDYIRQREKDTGLKNIFLTEIKPEMSRDDRLEILIKALQKQGWTIKKYNILQWKKEIYKSIHHVF